MPLNNPSFRAGGDILPSRFVRISADFTVIAAINATFFPIGISQDGTKFPEATDGFGAGAQTIAAASGDQIRVFGASDTCLLEVDNTGSNITFGTLLSAGAAGIGVLATNTAAVDFVGAIALEAPPAGLANALIRVQVTQFVTSAAA